MKPTTVQLERFEQMYGWANRLLRVNLSTMKIEAHPTASYVPDFLGARGIAAKICWDEYPEPVPPFDSENPLMVMTGALTGSSSPYSGRTNICAFSPQAYPYPWFTRSSVGAHFGGELKRAGYDGIVVTGEADTPVRIRIRDDEVGILPADDLWGQGALETLEALVEQEGKGVQSLAIGQAGENMSHIATIQAGSSSASGQGGFGGVMGSKKLKVISVIGTGQVALASPETMTSIRQTLVQVLAKDGRPKAGFFGGKLEELNQKLAAEGSGKARCHSCTESCLTPCSTYFENMPGQVHNRTWSGLWHCVGLLFGGYDDEDPAASKEMYDWQLVRRAAFELNVLSNTYGLNQFDVLMGMVPWLILCQKAEMVTEVNGNQIDWCSPEFWNEFLRIMAYREGMGDILAKGGWAASRELQLGEEFAQRRYAGWGQAGHWDGHEGPWLSFPFWLTSALQWLIDTRDPFSTGHGSAWLGARIIRAAGLEDQEERDAIVQSILAISDRLYGSADAFDPHSGYKDKARVAHFHTLRPVIKDCVPVDDLAFPMIYCRSAPDRYWRLSGIEGIGDIEGPSIEYHLFKAGTGADMSEEMFTDAAERVCALERALQVRHWGRDRKIDELVYPYFENEEAGKSPYLDRSYRLDRDQFAPLVNELYTLHGWDAVNGWPTRETLQNLGLGAIHEQMISGAKKATEKQGQTRESDGH
ncbi:aldehyde ferredoxin oxidoreductase N-terminal domain-containing protein [Candidatus Bipolaricaulota bacterium]